MRDKNKSKKYQSIVATGKELFWRYGIKRVSLEEICKDASVSKMTFYKYFPNKIDLAKSILESILEESFEKFDLILESDSTFQNKVEQMLLMKMEGTKDISAEFLNDVYGNPDIGLHQLMEHAHKRSTKMFTRFLETEQEKGEIRSDIKIDFVIYQMNLMTQIVNDQTMLDKYDTPNQLIMESMRFLFYGLMPINKEG
ncbi:TetR/AcrR family transcriptional regulator [Carboxylicivirga marina]|uniref:TetR/AcrR family transcriptional regulator n=1 Tax=Carboxylicivirga marina TaxID=2800988 RepID=A0ABS1HF96_9BACT|nr:TetR/AcrR family transcriptional regulator [Carboxylicivirga marina]MBK3516314.1 TetR/AcrR family transcriptional regulator [Carboxylicivirga marina]